MIRAALSSVAAASSAACSSSSAAVSAAGGRCLLSATAERGAVSVASARAGSGEGGGDGRPASAAAAAVASAAVAAAAVVASASAAAASSSSSRSQKSRPPSHVGLIEADLMDRIASKPYVNYHNWTTTTTSAPSNSSSALAPTATVRRRRPSSASRDDDGGGDKGSSSGDEAKEAKGSDEKGKGEEVSGEVKRGRRPSRSWGGANNRRRLSRRYIPEGYGSDDDDGKEEDEEESSSAYDENEDYDDDGEDFEEGGDFADLPPRPRGVPRTVRILAVDVPQMREVFDGDCRVSAMRSFPDDVAPRKRIKRKQKQRGQKGRRRKDHVDKDDDNHDNDSSDSGGSDQHRRQSRLKRLQHDESMEIVQKSFVRSLVKCRTKGKSAAGGGHVGVEILEASMAGLNPRNVRRTYRFGGKDGYRYDPGKYAEGGGGGGEEKGEKGRKGGGGGKDTEEVKGGEGAAKEEERADASGDDNGSSVATAEEDDARYSYAIDDAAGPADVDEYEGWHDTDDVPPSGDEAASLARRATIQFAFGDEKEESDEETKGTETNDKRKSEEDRTEKKDGHNNDDAADKEYDEERHAPWNQYAWIEEIDLRVRGLVPFGGNLERGSAWQRYVWGNAYRDDAVPSARSWWARWLDLPPALTGDVFGDDGVDGDEERFGGERDEFGLRRWRWWGWWQGRGAGSRTNRASSKPHAVVVDGSAALRIPGSLRHLARVCKDADVPLFVVNDPRGWGGNTHDSLASAAVGLRKAVKARTVVHALRVKEGSMFERGRMMGTVETEAKWRTKDAGRRTRKAIEDARDRMVKRREERERERLEKREEEEKHNGNWGDLDGEALRRKLEERGVIVVDRGDGSSAVNKEGKEEEGTESAGAETYSAGFVELCRTILGYSDDDMGKIGSAAQNAERRAEEFSMSN